MISGVLYQDIVCQLDIILHVSGYAMNELIAALSTMNTSTATYAQKAIVNQQLSTLRDTLADIYGRDVQALSVLAAMNRLVVSQMAFADFITTNFISVPQSVATASASLGFIVPVSNISSGAC